MKIIVVDDNASNRLLLSTLATRLTDDVVSFANPLEALDWCDKQTPDLVILDYLMPELDGHSFISRFRAKPYCASVPLIMATVSDQSDIRRKAFELGATEFLTKPIDTIEFHLRVRNLLTLRQAQLTLEENVQTAYHRLETREAEILATIAQAAEFHDSETGAHTRRVGLYSELIAHALGIPEPFPSDLCKTAPMHDLGKIGIPDSILLKPGKLTPEEMKIMRTHPEIGARIAGKSEFPLMKLAAEISLSHHERFDGTGYPRALMGEDIPLSGRIVAIADVFDALTTERSYKEAWPLEKVQQFLVDNTGSHFCPKCIAAFLSVWDDALHIKNQYSTHMDTNLGADMRGIGIQSLNY